MLPVPATDYHEELGLRTYVAVLGRRWKAIAISLAVTLALALAFTLTQDAQYRAEADILIGQSDTATIVGEQTINATDAARRLNNEVRLFESVAIERVVEERYDGDLDPHDVDAAVESDNADVLRAHLTAADPDAAADLVNLYVETFIDVRRQQRVDELLAVGAGIQEKLNELDARISAADEEAIPALLSQRSFYENQLEDVEVSADITETSGAKLLTNAIPPTSPTSPRPLRDLALGGILGLVIGVGIAFLIDALDERIRTVADVERISRGLPTLAVVPQVERGHTGGFVATRDASGSPQAEAFRGLRTSVKFAALRNPINVLQITSAAQGVGKTTTVANLAVAMAQDGDRVAIVCSDLRRPQIQERFGVDVAPGLTDVLAGDARLDQVVRWCATNLVVLTSGTLVRNPSELLSSQATETAVRAIAAETSMVLLDSTPVLPVTDALVMSRLADATIVVVDGKYTTRRALRRTLQLLAQVNAPVLGLVLNGVSDATQTGYGYGYRQYTERRRRRWGRSAEDSNGAHPAPRAQASAAPAPRPATSAPTQPPVHAESPAPDPWAEAPAPSRMRAFGPSE